MCKWSKNWRVSVSDKLPGNADTTGPWVTLITLGRLCALAPARAIFLNNFFSIRKIIFQEQENVNLPINYWHFTSPNDSTILPHSRSMCMVVSNAINTYAIHMLQMFKVYTNTSVLYVYSINTHSLIISYQSFINILYFIALNYTMVLISSLFWQRVYYV